MNRENAVSLMRQGIKITHPYFSPEEWMVDSGGMVLFEDGYMCSYTEYWKDRLSQDWNENWKIWDGQQLV